MLLPLLLSVIPAVLIGWAFKGRLTALAELPLRWIWLIVAGLAVQVAAIIIGTYLLVVIGLARNWRVPGMAVVTLGFALNFAVILANGGQMPVTRETIEASGQGWLLTETTEGQPILQSKDVLLPKGQTHLWALSDIFITPPPVRRAASIGDFVTYAGVALVIVAAMRRRRDTPGIHTPAAAAA